MEDDFSPEHLINNRFKNENTIKNSMIKNYENDKKILEEEDDTLNKIVIERPVVKNKKKQKLQKIILEDSVKDLPNNKKTNDNNVDKDIKNFTNKFDSLISISEEKKEEKFPILIEKKETLKGENQKISIIKEEDSNLDQIIKSSQSIKNEEKSSKETIESRVNDESINEDFTNKTKKNESKILELLDPLKGDKNNFL